MTVQIDSAPVPDADLLTRVRDGDTDAYGELYRRHADAARRLAVVLARDGAEAEDLAAEAFARVLATLRGGGGPQTAFRPYLLTAVRNAFYDRVRRSQKVEPTDTIEEYERPEPYEDPSIAALERSYAARAFARLPERWRAVLWHTEVEGESPTQIAPLFGLTANAVAVLAFRARERLRQGYLAEHITLTGSPRCHWTGEHLPGYVRAGLAGRERTKVEDHLAECAECRRLHRELTEANVGLRAVLAPLVLGAAAPAYVLTTAGKTGFAALWASLAAAVATWWSGVLQALTGAWTGLGRLAADAWWWISTLPTRLARRYGGPNVAAAAGLVVAAVLGVAFFVVGVVVAPTGQPQSRGTTAADLPVPAPAEPPTLTSAPQPPLLTSPAPRPTLSEIPVGPNRSQTRTGDAVTIGPDPGGVALVAGGKNTLPIVVERTRAESAPLAAGPTGDGAGRTTDAGRTTGEGRPEERAAAWVFTLGLPPAITLTGADAGDGWTCRAAEAKVTCSRAKTAARSTARVPIAVAPGAGGFQQVTMRFRDKVRTFRLPVAPEGTRIAYAGLGRLRTAIAGNALLSCLPRPACLTDDNNLLTMVPLQPFGSEPGPPGRELPDLGGAVAASGALLSVPAGGRVTWAGMVVGGSDGKAPGRVSVRGPGGSWQEVRLRAVGSPAAGTRQVYADVTSLVRKRGGGPWWLAASAGLLPSGRGAYAGWSLAVVYEQAKAPLAEVAVQLGPVHLATDDDAVAVRVPAGARVEVALALWDGDRGLGGDGLRLGGHALGTPGNLGQGVSPSAHAVACASAGCVWRTPGLDVLRLEGRADSAGSLTLRPGDDPLDLALLAYGHEVGEAGR
ncbi:MAG: sigma-70 family RNA polymerase sigma factor [Hamadaea sp.]|nr:sigma-70 family RNA polymerase sigma factor [Hamadaea sp.]